MPEALNTVLQLAKYLFEKYDRLMTLFLFLVMTFPFIVIIALYSEKWGYMGDSPEFLELARIRIEMQGIRAEHASQAQAIEFIKSGTTESHKIQRDIARGIDKLCWVQAKTHEEKRTCSSN